MRKVALITGGQRGIGLGIAEALSAAGYAIVLVDLPDKTDQQVTQALDRLTGRRLYLPFDMAEAAEASAPLLDRIEADLGPVTTFVNNAGISAPTRGDMLTLKPQNFDLVMGVNLRGAFFLAQAVARRMLQTSGQDYCYRSLQFVTSVSADLASVDRAEYCLSKAAASMMAQLYALRLAEAGIGVFELRPGIIETPMTAGVKDQYNQRIAAGLVPASRWGYPEDIGAVVVPLAEGAFAFSTGAVIPIDGALSVGRL